ncbi:hypothetical protein ACFXHA_03930 [Nocardia sp. NPDC059240]|uniref:hypothetical protein n=1 Tax=Nocardia sp. NPDC059240 TaxID=3346786 RepID=UPI0036C03007
MSFEIPSVLGASWKVEFIYDTPRLTDDDFERLMTDFKTVNQSGFSYQGWSQRISLGRSIYEDETEDWNDGDPSALIARMFRELPAVAVWPLRTIRAEYSTAVENTRLVPQMRWLKAMFDRADDPGSFEDELEVAIEPSPQWLVEMVSRVVDFDAERLAYWRERLEGCDLVHDPVAGTVTVTHDTGHRTAREAMSSLLEALAKTELEPERISVRPFEG